MDMASKISASICLTKESRGADDTGHGSGPECETYPAYRGFASLDNNLYMMTKDGSTASLLRLLGE